MGNGNFRPDGSFAKGNTVGEDTRFKPGNAAPLVHGLHKNTVAKKTLADFEQPVVLSPAAGAREIEARVTEVYSMAMIVARTLRELEKPYLDGAVAMWIKEADAWTEMLAALQADNIKAPKHMPKDDEERMALLVDKAELISIGLSQINHSINWVNSLTSGGVKGRMIDLSDGNNKGKAASWVAASRSLFTAVRTTLYGPNGFIRLALYRDSDRKDVGEIEENLDVYRQHIRSR